jgi:hypothetical protein
LKNVRHSPLCSALLLTLPVATWSPAARADYAAEDRAWNGLYGLTELARELAIDLRDPGRIDLAEVRPGDGILVVYPRQPPPVSQLTAFMSEGGRLAIADDFGASEGLLASFGVRRSDAPPRAARRLRGNLNLLIATATDPHPLNTGAATLVTNHPAMLRHPALHAVFGFDHGKSAVALAGVVGAGRLVALGDPSVLINNMLAFRDNRRFAQNLVRYLSQGGKLWLATPETEIAGIYHMHAGGDAIGRIRLGLERLARLTLPESALRLTSLFIAILLLLAAATAVPRRSSYVRAVSLPASETFAGFLGRIHLFQRPRANLLAPALTYKQEFERRLVSALHLRGRPSLSDVASALRTRGIAEARVAEARALLVELQQFAIASERSSPPPHVSPWKLHAISSTGDRILASLDSDPRPAHEPRS